MRRTQNVCEIITLDLSYVVAVKSTVEISQNFVAFLFNYIIWMIDENLVNTQIHKYWNAASERKYWNSPSERIYNPLCLVQLWGGSWFSCHQLTVHLIISVTSFCVSKCFLLFSLYSKWWIKKKGVFYCEKVVWKVRCLDLLLTFSQKKQYGVRSVFLFN